MTRYPTPHPMPAITTNPRVRSNPDSVSTREFAPPTLQKSRTCGGVAGTGWEPAAVYTHLDRLTALDADADVPIPGGPTPKQLGSNATFIPLTALTEGLSPKRTSASSGHPRST